MIKTRNLGRQFDGTVAVEDLTLDIPAGEVFGFLGPNGAGKTTTVRMLSGLIGPSRGQAWVAGCQVGMQDAQLRRRVGVLTETPGLYDRLSAERNLGFFAQLYGVDRPEQRVERFLRMLGLWERRDEPAGTFSKGMRQKLAIARAMLHEPQVLFLDEPTSGLDPEMAHLVREFIGELKQEGRTIFLCTHNLPEADALCDRIAVFNVRLLAMDTPGALRRSLFGRTVVFHLASYRPEFLQKVQAFDFVRQAQQADGKLLVTLEDPEAQNPALVRSLVEAGAQIQFVGELRRSLEEVYLRLVHNPEGQP
jgi:ABC-2 type transport system ATP-binding protein